MFVALILITLTTALFTVYILSRKKFDYWKKQNVPHLEPATIFGNFKDYILLRRPVSDVFENILDKFPDEPYVGAYYGTEPVLILNDPEIIKLVTTKEFYYFHGRENSSYSERELVTQNVFRQAGDIWKVSRQNMTPLFSSSKMKNMFHLIEKCSRTLEKSLDREIGDSNIINSKIHMPRFTMACIGSCAFGIDVDTLGDNHETNKFLHIGDLIFEVSTVRGMNTVARSIWPAIFYMFGLKLFPTKLDRFFKKFLTEVFESRKYKSSGRNDFIDLMLNLREKKYISGDSIHNGRMEVDKKIDIPVTDTYMITQCLMFFGAGFETSSTVLTFTLFELAKNLEAQKKVQEEIDLFLKKHNNKLVYDCVTELPYTDACLDETMRLHPVLTSLAREVMHDYTLPTGLTLHKGVRVHIPVYYFHTNPKYFPDPMKYKPERFLGEEKNNIKPHTYFPFGDGSRLCIGMRFGKMEMLAGLVTILKKYDMELAEGMPSTLQMNPCAFVTNTLGDINIKFTRREGWESREYAA